MKIAKFMKINVGILPAAGGGERFSSEGGERFPKFGPNHLSPLILSRWKTSGLLCTPRAKLSCRPDALIPLFLSSHVIRKICAKIRFVHFLELTYADISPLHESLLNLNPI